MYFMFLYLEDGHSTLPRNSVSTRPYFFRNVLDRLHIKCKFKLFQRTIKMKFKIFQNINTDSSKFIHTSSSERRSFGLRPDIARTLLPN